MFITKNKLLKMIINKKNEIIKSKKDLRSRYFKNGKTREARDMNFYIDGAENVFDWIIGILEK